MWVDLYDEIFQALKALTFPAKPEEISEGWDRFNGMPLPYLVETPAVVETKTKSTNRSKCLNLVSWNVSTCDNFDEVLAHLRNLDSMLKGIDVLCLQELGINYPGNPRDTFRDLADGLDYSGIFGLSMALLDKRSKPLLNNGKPILLGESLMTRLPFNAEEAKLIRMPPVYDWLNRYSSHSGSLTQVRRSGNRVAVSVPLQAAKTRFVAASAHTEDKAWPNKRGLQVDELLRRLNEYELNQVLVGGDFNTIFGRQLEDTYSLFSNQGYSAANGKRSTAIGLPLRLDHIFYKGFGLRNFEADTTTTTSDHYPIIAQFER